MLQALENPVKNIQWNTTMISWSYVNLNFSWCQYRKLTVGQTRKDCIRIKSIYIFHPSIHPPPHPSLLMDAGVFIEAVELNFVDAACAGFISSSSFYSSSSHPQFCSSFSFLSSLPSFLACLSSLTPFFFAFLSDSPFYFHLLPCLLLLSLPFGVILSAFFSSSSFILFSSFSPFPLF